MGHVGWSEFTDNLSVHKPITESALCTCASGFLQDHAGFVRDEVLKDSDSDRDFTITSHVIIHVKKQTRTNSKQKGERERMIWW